MPVGATGLVVTLPPSSVTEPFVSAGMVTVSAEPSFLTVTAVSVLIPAVVTPEPYVSSLPFADADNTTDALSA